MNWISPSTKFQVKPVIMIFCPNLAKKVFLIQNRKVALLCAGADRHNGILMSLLLLVAETIKPFQIDLLKISDFKVSGLFVSTQKFSASFINWGCTFDIRHSFMTCFKSPVKRKIKTMALRKQRSPNFLTFLTPWYAQIWVSGGKKYRLFLENFAWFHFL